jgi:arginyl-tRNA synthetase
VQAAALNYSPAEIANYIYQLAKLFNHFYADHSVLKAENDEKLQLRAVLTVQTGQILKLGLHLLGIEAPERM